MIRLTVRLGRAQRRALLHAGLVPGEATPADVEKAFYEPGSLVQRLAPPEVTMDRSEPAPPTHRPRYRWTISTG